MEQKAVEEQRDLLYKLKNAKKSSWSNLKCNSKRKRPVQDLLIQGYLSKALQNFHSNLKKSKSDSQDRKNACKFAKHRFEKLDNGDFEDGVAKKLSFCWWWS